MAPTQPRSRPPGRRRLLGCALALTALGGVAWQRTRAERRLGTDRRALRPPGALAEAGFLAACVRCGLCVQACPWRTLRLADGAGPVAAGTPYFRAREVPCAMCDPVPCQRACPTGALGHRSLRITDARMGLAGLNRPEACYSFIGAAACNSCFKACPLRGRAITMRQGVTRLGGRFTPTVDGTVCTGCGRCEQACIAEQPAITVLALQQAERSGSRDGPA